MNAFRECLTILMIFLVVTALPVLVMVGILRDFRKYVVSTVIVYTWLILMATNVILNVVGIFLAIILI